MDVQGFSEGARTSILKEKQLAVMATCSEGFSSNILKSEIFKRCKSMIQLLCVRCFWALFLVIIFLVFISTSH